MGVLSCFFFQAEDGIRDGHVTGVQTCALPISLPTSSSENGHRGGTRRSPGRFEYERGVERAKRHIRAGDAFQIVLSQRAERPTTASALQLYRALRRVNPSPYLFLLELDDLALVGSSPETLVKAEDGSAELNPIAGTTHPGDGDAERLLAS